MQNESNIDAKLDEIALKQTVWKNEKMMSACVSIAKKAVELGTFWPDELKFETLGKDDRNLIGSAWRICIKTLGLIEKTGQFQRSKGGDANGRIIFQYRVVNLPLANSFIKRSETKL